MAPESQSAPIVRLAVKGWSEFQHYKHRKPPWIRLYRKLLDDLEWHRLSVASRALAPLLWLLASEYEDGKIDASEEKLAFRFRLPVTELREAIKPLIDTGFFIIASGALAECKPVASLEKEREKQRCRQIGRQVRVRNRGRKQLM